MLMLCSDQYWEPARGGGGGSTPVFRVIQRHILCKHRYGRLTRRVGGFSTDSGDTCSRGDVDYPTSCTGLCDGLLDHLFDGFTHGRCASFAIDRHHNIPLLVGLFYEVAKGPPDAGVVD